jgi:hypothetical protein
MSAGPRWAADSHKWRAADSPKAARGRRIVRQPPNSWADVLTTGRPSSIARSTYLRNEDLDGWAFLSGVTQHSYVKGLRG